MSDLTRSSKKHIKLFIPGPTEVTAEILDAQTEWMIGHRMSECSTLIGEFMPKLKKVFRTEQRVLFNACSGTGMWEAASRNCIAKKVLHLVNGSFAEKWADVSALNGKEVEVVNVEWGKPILPEHMLGRLATGEFDAVAFVHNETSTGVTSPVKEIAQAIRALPNGQDITIMVDSVSGLSGAELEFDAWDLDVVLTGSQKAFALPPGLAFVAVSNRAFEKAKTVKNRGYYFDFISLDKSLTKNETPSTPAISLLYALSKQLDNMMAETMEKRWARHIEMREVTLAWAKERGFAPLPELAYCSPTVSTISNTLKVDIKALNSFLKKRGMTLSNGYGTLKDITFRIGHMGDWQVSDIQELLANFDDFLVEQGLLQKSAVA